MRTLKLTLSYDGTDFVGWQRQASDRSVQGVVEEALSQIDQRAVAVAGAGRTDSGVHALGQVASAVVANEIGLPSLHRALNVVLPPDVRVIALEDAGEGFNARFGARSKTYRYRIVIAEVLSPFERRYAWHLPGRLDLDRMRASAGEFIGRHDFAALQAAGGKVSSTVRTIVSSQWSEDALSDGGRVLTYEIAGDGFLRYMVRNIVGTLVEVGSGRRRSDSVRDLLDSKDRSAAGPTAPAHGLYLVEVRYE